mgnify:CR=1 FL=1
MNLIDKLLIKSDQSIREAMNLIDQNAQGITFVVDEDRKLLGVATDGDLRRSLLEGCTLETNIKSAMNIDFTSLPITSEDSLIRKTFSSKLRMIPLCDESGNIVDVADSQRSHRIPLIEPNLSGREMEYVNNCIETNWISSQGSYVGLFEKQFEDMHVGMRALAVSNGTVALHLALSALGIKSGDEVILPNVTFAATINSVIYCNATPVLCEINSETMCIDPREVEKLVSDKTKAIIPVHLYGQVCNMEQLSLIAQKYNILMIEDCAEAIGSSIENIPVGTFCDASTFSFFGNKTISTGEGGMVLFKDEKIYSEAKILRDHGMTPGKRYWHDKVGFNYRLTNLQAAIGVAQMERLGEIIDRKRKIAKFYNEKFKNINEILQMPFEIEKTVHSNWLYTVVMRPEINRDLVMKKMLTKGIDTRPIFYPLHEMPPYREFSHSEVLNNSISCSHSGISFPSSITLKENELNFIADTFIEIIKKKT